MEMTEQQYFDVFGVQDDRESPPVADTEDSEVSEIPGETPESVHEPETEGENSPDSADTAEEQAEDNQGKKHQSRGQNAKYAAARREAEAKAAEEIARVKAEQDKAIAEAVQKAKAEARDELLQELGHENPYTKSKITNDAELKEYQAEHAKKQHEKLLRTTGQTEEQFQAMVDSLPEVREAKAKAQEAERVLEARKQEQMKAWVEAELAEVGKYNPAIRTADDLAKDTKYQDILTYVEKGLSISDAYKMAHFDDLSTRKGRQQAINQAGKAHMTSTKSRGEGSYEVPADELSWYHQLMPKATTEQIAKHYNKMVQT